MSNDLNLQAPWVGQSDYEYFGWKSEEDEEAEEIAYWEHVDRLIDERKEDEALRQIESNDFEENRDD